MAYLLAKIFIMLLLAAVFGALLYRWWSRRYFQEVTSEFIRSEEEWKEWRKLIEARLEQAGPGTDGSTTHLKIDALASAVRGIKIPTAAIAADVVTALAPLQQRIESVDLAMQAIHAQERLVHERLDLGPLEARLEQVEAALRSRKPQTESKAEMAKILERLTAIENLLYEATQAPAEPLADEVYEEVEANPLVPTDVVPEPDAQTANDTMAAEAAPLPEAAAEAPPEVAEPAAPPQLEGLRSGSRNLLTSATYGEADDLKRIKGVATVMEKMLHDIGVYYFWQVAEWTEADVAHADAQLPRFKGRITRDEWVKQAIEFAKLPTSAKRPFAAVAVEPFELVPAG
jgi:predicted flap endonuclease-1-like 5' DNA nuclease